MSERAKVVAIDPSLTGFAITVAHNEGSFYSVEYGSKPATGLLARFARYDGIIEKAEKVLRKNYPELLLIEGYSFNSKGRSTVTLGEFGGVVRKALMGYADMTVEVPPAVLKKFLTGKGTANKVLMVSTATKRYDEQFDTDNQADAFVLAKLGLSVLGCEKVSTKFQRDAVEKVRALIQQETVDE